MELIKDFGKAIQERITNPVIGTFILIWAVVNWKLVLFLAFSTIPIQRRITYIQENYISWECVLILPLLYVAIYLLGLPYILYVVERVTTHSGTLRKKVANKKLVKDIELQIDVVRANLKLEEETIRLKEFTELKAKIEELEVALEAKSEELHTVENQYNKFKTLVADEIDKRYGQLMMLVPSNDWESFSNDAKMFLKDPQNRKALDSLTRYLRMDRKGTIGKFDLEILLNNQLVDFIDKPKIELNKIIRTDNVKITEKGRIYLLLYFHEFDKMKFINKDHPIA